MRVAPFCGQGVVESGSVALEAASERCGFSVWKCRWAGSVPCCAASTSLHRPDAPALPSRWPTLVLTEPRKKSPSLAKTAAIASTSIGSPSGVPVPCASR